LNEQESMPEALFLMAEIYGDARYAGKDPDEAATIWASGVSHLDEPSQARIDHLKVLFSQARSDARLRHIAAEAAAWLRHHGRCPADKILGGDHSQLVEQRPAAVASA
jgi:hypothetical protein